MSIFSRCNHTWPLPRSRFYLIIDPFLIMSSPRPDTADIPLFAPAILRSRHAELLSRDFLCEQCKSPLLAGDRILVDIYRKPDADILIVIHEKCLHQAIATATHKSSSCIELVHSAAKLSGEEKRKFLLLPHAQPLYKMVTWMSQYLPDVMESIDVNLSDQQRLAGDYIRVSCVVTNPNLLVRRTSFVLSAQKKSAGVLNVPLSIVHDIEHLRMMLTRTYVYDVEYNGDMKPLNLLKKTFSPRLASDVGLDTCIVAYVVREASSHVAKSDHIKVIVRVCPNEQVLSSFSELIKSNAELEWVRLYGFFATFNSQVLEKKTVVHCVVAEVVKAFEQNAIEVYSTLKSAMHVVQTGVVHFRCMSSFEYAGEEKAQRFRYVHNAYVNTDKEKLNYVFCDSIAGDPPRVVCLRGEIHRDRPLPAALAMTSWNACRTQIKEELVHSNLIWIDIDQQEVIKNDCCNQTTTAQC
jgi:hypothetical protein